ncbi:MAG: DNA translocase FtsK [Planctomycetales bacterium]|nr:DNA translocase FtsK [Planctomycetales bacterium]
MPSVGSELNPAVERGGATPPRARSSGRLAAAGGRRRPALREAAGLTLVLGATFALLSLATFHPGDCPELSYPVNDPVRNAGGRAGATLAFGVLHFLGGIGAYALVGLVAAWGLAAAFARGARPIRPLWRACGGALFLAAAAAADTLLAAVPLHGIPAGGALGTVLGRLVLQANFGTTGAFLILAWGAALSFLLATDLLFLSVVREAVARGRRLLETSRGIALAPGAPPAAPAPGPEALPEPPVRFELPLSLSARPAPQGLPVPVEPAPVPRPRDPATTRKVGRAERGRTEPRPAGPESGPRGGGGDIAPVPAPPGARWVLPPADYLEMPESAEPTLNLAHIREKGVALTKALESFRIGAKVVDVEVGPVITQYELELAPGVKVQSVAGLATDLAVALKAPKVRVVAPIPGRDTIGVEVPNLVPSTVRLSELLARRAPADREKALPLFIGKDAAGRELGADLAEMPHLLVAGATGSGKSVCLNSLILSLLYTRTPDQLRLLLVDPKMVELSAFRDIPHLLAPVVTDMRKAAGVLEWLAGYMDERYELFARVGVKSLAQYNRLGSEAIRERLRAAGDEDVAEVPFPLPHVVLFVDEVADLMLVSRNQVEGAMARLAQKSRAVGIHAVLATQRPSADVVTGLIKANMPCRIAFQVSGRVNSQVILDQPGAEDLVGRGDMLFMPPRASALIRAQGTFVSDEEVHRVVEFLRTQGSPQYEAGVLSPAPAEPADGEEDPLWDRAVEIVRDTGRASATLLQRRLSVGYSRAARLVDEMERRGIVSPHKGLRAREVIGAAGE